MAFSRRLSNSWQTIFPSTKSIWFNLDVCGIICGSITYALIGFADVTFCFHILNGWPAAFQWINAVLFNVIVGLSVWAHLACMLSNPGALTKGNPIESVSSMKNQLHYPVDVEISANHSRKYSVIRDSSSNSMPANTSDAAVSRSQENVLPSLLPWDGGTLKGVQDGGGILSSNRQTSSAVYDVEIANSGRELTELVGLPVAAPLFDSSNPYLPRCNIVAIGPTSIPSENRLSSSLTEPMGFLSHNASSNSTTVSQSLHQPYHRTRETSSSEATLQMDLSRSVSGVTTPLPWCTKCNREKPPRAHHCSVCQRCIHKMDHHCPWVNNCYIATMSGYTLTFLFVRVGSCLMDAADSMQPDLPRANSLNRFRYNPDPFLRMPVEKAVLGDNINSSDQLPPGVTRGLLRLLFSKLPKASCDFPLSSSICFSIVFLEGVIFGLFTSIMSCDQFVAITQNTTGVEQLKKTKNRTANVHVGFWPGIIDVCGESFSWRW